MALFFNASLSTFFYFAVLAGPNAIVDAYAMISTRLTRAPERSALGYLALAAASFLSVPATNSDNKWLRRLFAVFAFLFAIAWTYQAANFTLGHLEAI